MRCSAHATPADARNDETNSSRGSVRVVASSRHRDRTTVALSVVERERAAVVTRHAIAKPSRASRRTVATTAATLRCGGRRCDILRTRRARASSDPMRSSPDLSHRARGRHVGVRELDARRPPEHLRPGWVGWSARGASDGGGLSAAARDSRAFATREGAPRARAPSRQRGAHAAATSRPQSASRPFDRSGEEAKSQEWDASRANGARNLSCWDLAPQPLQ